MNALEMCVISVGKKSLAGIIITQISQIFYSDICMTGQQCATDLRNLRILRGKEKQRGENLRGKHIIVHHRR